MITKKIKESVRHQGIGGKKFIVDEYITKSLNNDMIFKESLTGNWACKNFIDRRPDFDSDFPYKLYYGKVEGYGYIVAEDEFEDFVNEYDNLNRRARYMNVSEEQQKRINVIRKMFSDMYDYIENNCKTGRETSLSITKLEEAQFWAIKSISREYNQKGEDENGRK